MRHLIWAGIALSAACGSSEPATTAMVRDSAGIRIVESHEPAWSEGDAWRVSEGPTRSFGSADGRDGVAFDRLAGVYLLDGDRVAVLDNGASQVMIFGTGGEPFSTFGRAGEGPGEFRSLAFLGLQTDSLWILDGRQMRIAVLDTRSGRFREMRADLRNLAMGPVGLLSDGSPVVASNLAFSTALDEAPPAGFQRFRASYHRIDALGASSDTVVVTPGAELMLRYGDGTVEILRPFVARAVSHAIRGDELVQGVQTEYEISIYGTDGALRSVIRRPGVDLTLDDQQYEAAVEERVAAAPEQARAGIRNLYLTEVRPERIPAYARFLVDSEGHLWVQDFAYHGEARRWSVFDPAGAWLGVVELPESFEMTHVLSDRIAGIWRDELDIEYARVYALERGPVRAR